MEVINFKDLIARGRVSQTAGMDDLIILGQNNPVNIQEYPGYVMKVSDFLGMIPPPPAVAIQTGKEIYIDGVYGNDTTGARERFDRPFLTPAAAVAAALPGDTIIWRPSTYSVFTNLMKAGVNHYAMKGVFLNIFTNAFNLDTLSGGPVISGNIDFRGHAVVLSCTGNLCSIRTNPTAVLNLEFDQVNVNNISNGVLLFDGLTYLKIRGNYTCAGRCFSMRNTSNLVADIDGVCTTTFANNFNGVFWNSITAWSGTAYIKAKSFALPTTAVVGDFRHIYQDNAQGCKIDIELDYLSDSSLVAPGIIRIAATGGTTGCQASLKIKNVSVASRLLFECTDPNAYVRIQYDLGVGTSSGGSVSAGRLNLDSSRLQTNFNVAVAGGFYYMNNSTHRVNSVEVIRQTGGTVSLMGSTLITNGVAASIDNTAGITLSEGSKANVAPTNPVTGNLYINPLYVD